LSNARKDNICLYIMLLLFGLLMILSACTTESKPIDPTQQQRMSELRKRFKNELGEKYDLSIPAATAAQLKRGAELYPQVCASCHGGRGDGLGKISEGLAGNPTSFTDPEQAAFFSERARLGIIRKGVPGTPMMGWQNVLTEEDIQALYCYIRSLIGQK